MKRPTQIDKAIAQLERDLIDLRRSYESTRLGLENAISALHAQQAAKPARKKTPTEVK